LLVVIALRSNVLNPEDNARKVTSLANQTWIFENASAAPKLGIWFRLSL